MVEAALDLRSKVVIIGPLLLARLAALSNPHDFTVGKAMGHSNGNQLEELG
jgi:hypothetical protein